MGNASTLKELCIGDGVGQLDSRRISAVTPELRDSEWYVLYGVPEDRAWSILIFFKDSITGIRRFTGSRAHFNAARTFFDEYME